MSDPSGQSNETTIRLRIAISNAYAMVKSLSRAVSLAEATPEQLMEERIVELIGPSDNPRRPSRLDQIKTIRAEFQSAIQQIRSMSPEQLGIQDASDEQNNVLTEDPDGGE